LVYRGARADSGNAGRRLSANYYDLLGITKKSGQDAIKVAYRQLAKAYHPDLNAIDPSATERFARISKAYRVLGNPELRRIYDARLRGSQRGGVLSWVATWRDLRMVATLSMLASTTVTGTLSFLAITWWDHNTQLARIGPMAEPLATASAAPSSEPTPGG